MLDMFGQSVGVQKAESAFPMLFLDSWISTKGSATPVTCSCGSLKKKQFAYIVTRFVDKSSHKTTSFTRHHKTIFFADVCGTN